MEIEESKINTSQITIEKISISNKLNIDKKIELTISYTSLVNIKEKGQLNDVELNQLISIVPIDFEPSKNIMQRIILSYILSNNIHINNEINNITLELIGRYIYHLNNDNNNNNLIINNKNIDNTQKRKRTNNEINN